MAGHAFWFQIPMRGNEEYVCPSTVVVRTGFKSP